MPDFSSPQDIKLLLQSCKELGIDPGTIECDNPHLRTGKVAESLQMAASALDPVRAATWARDAGKKASLASVSALMGMSEMSKETHENLLAVDPQYVLDCNAHAERHEQELLDRMTREGEALHRANYVNIHGEQQADRIIAAEKEQEAAQLAAQASGEPQVNYKRGQF